MKLYLAGPMTGYPEHNFPAFHRVTSQMRASGHLVFCPAESFGGRVDHPIQDYARADIHYLLQVEGVVLLPGWEYSDGAKREVVIATWLNLPFFMWTPTFIGHEPWLMPVNPTVWLHAWSDR